MIKLNKNPMWIMKIIMRISICGQICFCGNNLYLILRKEEVNGFVGYVEQNSVQGANLPLLLINTTDITTTLPYDHPDFSDYFKTDEDMSSNFFLSALSVKSGANAIGLDALKECVGNGEDFKLRTIIAVVSQDPNSQIEEINKREDTVCYNEGILDSILNGSFRILSNTTAGFIIHQVFGLPNDQYLITERILDAPVTLSQGRRMEFMRRIYTIFKKFKESARNTPEEVLAYAICIRYMPQTFKKPRRVPFGRGEDGL